MCELVRIHFRNNGQEFVEFNIDHDTTAKTRMVEISGQNKTPVVEIDERVIVGYRPDLYDLILEGKDTEELGLEMI